MPGFGIYDLKDVDGKRWTFAQQQKGFSCGPTCVKIAKEFFHNKTISEEAVQGLCAFGDSGQANTGVSLSQSAADSQNTWNNEGGYEDMLLAAVKSSPLPIPKAKFNQGINFLKNATRNHPAILGFNWKDGIGGGHFVVCVGPTKSDPTRFVILDPDSGIEYLSESDAVGDRFFYKPSYGLRGKLDKKGFIST